MSKLINRAKAVPKISAICITYGRRKLLEEAIQCFLYQDHPNKEMIVLNDEEGVHYNCDAPGVRVFNVPDKFKSIGAKRNYASRLASGEFLMPWDDDDIYLAHRMSFSLKGIGDKPFAHFQRGIYADPNESRISETLIGPNCLYKADKFWDLGAYDESIIDTRTAAYGEDHDLSIRFKRRYGPHYVHVPDDKMFYIYRWGLFPHMTTAGTLEKHQKAMHSFNKQAAGTIELKPIWRLDYNNIPAIRMKIDHVK